MTVALTMHSCSQLSLHSIRKLSAQGSAGRGWKDGCNTLTYGTGDLLHCTAALGRCGSQLLLW